MQWIVAGGLIARGINAGNLLSRRRLDKFIVDKEADWLLIFAAIRCLELDKKIGHVEDGSNAAL